MAPSVLRGRPTTTSYRYDEQGRIERTVTGSPWTEEDRALLLAYQLYRSSLCTGCGQPKHLAHHPDNDGWYETGEPIVCHACTALAKAGAKDPSSVDPVQMYRILHDRDYTTSPLPVLDLSDLDAA